MNIEHWTLITLNLTPKTLNLTLHTDHFALDILFKRYKLVPVFVWKLNDAIQNYISGYWMVVVAHLTLGVGRRNLNRLIM